ncbi:MAG TPA: hypothetical protein DDW17_02905 [Deltaproteobacteria bacterium]|nr:hypothetical protein [Deltaproteobacteria bacterium]
MIYVSLDDKYDINFLKLLNNIDFAEIRMDRMTLSGEDIRTIFSQPKRLIATCRPGYLTKSIRMDYLIKAIEAGASYVDIEIESDSRYRKDIIEKARSKGCVVIISYHNRHETPSIDSLNSIVTTCFKEGAQIAKVACMVNSPADCARLIGLLGNAGYHGRLVVIGMGAKGKITRVLAPLLGSPFTYASYEEGKETAPGQIEGKRLEEMIRLVGNG